MKIEYGNVFDYGQINSGVIIHGANCFSTMGAGIALQVSKFYPEAYQADFNDKRTPEEKLGDFTYFDYKGFVIVNAYTQFQPGANFDYDAITSALINVRNKFTGRKFYLPEIGSGIAGGDKEIIFDIMKNVFKNEDATLVIYK